MTTKVAILNPGYVWNPFQKWPRNKACFCGKAAKFKRCCFPKLLPAISEKDAQEARKFMKSYGLKC